MTFPLECSFIIHSGISVLLTHKLALSGGAPTPSKGAKGGTKLSAINESDFGCTYNTLSFKGNKVVCLSPFCNPISSSENLI